MNLASEKNLKFHQTSIDNLGAIFKEGILISHCPTDPPDFFKSLRHNPNYAHPIFRKRYISVSCIDGDLTPLEEGKKYKVPNGWYPPNIEVSGKILKSMVNVERNLKSEADRQRQLIEIICNDRYPTLIIAPSVPTIALGLVDYEHLVENDIKPKDIIGICYNNTSGEKMKESCRQIAIEYQKIIIEFDRNTCTSKLVEIN